MQWHIYSMSHVQYLCCWTTRKRHPSSPSASHSRSLFFFITTPVLVSSYFLIPLSPLSIQLFSPLLPPSFPQRVVLRIRPFSALPPSCCPSLPPPPLHQCMYDSGGEPSAGCRRQHQDRRLRLQQRVHAGQQAGHVLWLAALRCPRAFPGQEVRWARGGCLESRSHPVHAGQRLSALWWAEPEGKWIGGVTVCLSVWYIRRQEFSSGSYGNSNWFKYIYA